MVMLNITHGHQVGDNHIPDILPGSIVKTHQDLLKPVKIKPKTCQNLSSLIYLNLSKLDFFFR